MVVRIRLSSGTKVRQRGRKNQRLALATASLLTPASLMACALACWRVAADMNAAGQFPISTGLFSHWQVWLTLAGALQFCATVLNRYGKPEPMIHQSAEEPEPELADSRY